MSLVIPAVIVRLEGLGKLRKSSDFIGILIRDQLCYRMSHEFSIRRKLCPVSTKQREKQKS
jgi:hypothetical protein